MTTKQCADCRDGEHENYDDDVQKYDVRDPDNGGKFVKRAYLCGEHHDMYVDDGYTVNSLPKMRTR